MQGPRRLADDENSPLGVLVRAAIDDPAPRGASKRALAALGLAAGASVASIAPAHAGSGVSGAGSGAAAAAGAKPLAVGATSVIAKWIVGVTLASGLGASAVALVHDTERSRGSNAPTSAGHVAASRNVASRESAAAHDVAPPAAPEHDDVASPAAPTAMAHDVASPAVFGAPSRAVARSPSMSPLRGASAPLDAVDPVSDEVKLLDAARSALAGGAGSRALAFLDARDRRFPKGGLGPEAIVLRIEALANAGRSAEARALARSYLAASTSPPHAERVRRLAGL